MEIEEVAAKHAGEDPASATIDPASACAASRRASSPSASASKATQVAKRASSSCRRCTRPSSSSTARCVEINPLVVTERRRRARARRQDQLRRQRALPPQGRRGHARLRRGGPDGARGRRSTASLHRARRQHRLPGQRRRPGHGDDGHHQATTAASRRTSSTSAAAPPRSRSPQAFKIILSDPNVKGILVNIFGGIMQCDIIADGRRRRGASEVGLQVPLVVRLEGTNVELGKQDPGRVAACRSSPADDLDDGAQEDRAQAVSREAAQMSDPRRQGHQGHRPGHHRRARARSTPSRRIDYGTQDRRRRHARQGRPDASTACPVFDTVAEAVADDRRQRHRHLRAAALRRRRDPRGGRRRASTLVVCITEGIPVLDMVKVQRVLRGRRSTAPGRPELPRRHHARRVQDRHHAGLHPQARQASASSRARGTLTYEAVWQLTALGHRPVDLRRHRRRPGQRHELHRRACELFKRRPGHRRRSS